MIARPKESSALKTIKGSFGYDLYRRNIPALTVTIHPSKKDD